MAHEIANINGAYSFAYAGQPGWHGLGQVMQDGASVEEWAKAAGLAYQIKRARVMYGTAPEGHPLRQMMAVGDRVVQFRSDTFDYLGIVSDGFHTVQPIEVLELFRDWADRGGVKIETAGALFNGREYFALARIGEDVAIDGATDKLAPYIYCKTACDGSSATETLPTSIRVVCKNTARLAMARDGGKSSHNRQTHRSAFDQGAARSVIESASEAFEAYCRTARMLASVKVDSLKAAQMTAELIGAEKTATGKRSTGFAAVMALFQGGQPGAELDSVKGTAWGYYNAVTDYVDHSIRASSAENRFASAQSGPGAALKARALELVTAL
jgi:phage/plasmid-like protein (TIGR03299 family)